MAKTRPRPVELRRQMVELFRAGRDPTDLSREFQPSAQASRNWVADAGRSEGRRETKPLSSDPSLTTAERDEIVRLRRENRQLRLERDILFRAGDRSSAVGIFRFTSASQVDFPIAAFSGAQGATRRLPLKLTGRSTHFRRTIEVR